jgi:putative endonuclease
MPFDFATSNRRLAGKRAYRDGLAAEDGVAANYALRGYPVLARRWRGHGGEIDLVCQGEGELIFIEVKKADRHDWAAERLGFDQLERIALAAEEYIGTVADDPLTPMRLDLALVDAKGRIEVMEGLTLY